MKLTIYTTEEILKDILLDDSREENERKFPQWFLFIKMGEPDIKIMSTRSYEEDEDNPIEIFSQECDFPINLMNDNEIALVKEFRDSTLEKLGRYHSNADILNALHPLSVLILDIDENKANFITQRYGIVCHSLRTEPKYCPIFKENKEIYFKENPTNDLSGWNRLMKTEDLTPTNTLLFIDRYLFLYDSTNKAGLTQGCCGIIHFLDKILPPTLDGDFHVFIAFDIIQQWKVYLHKEKKKVEATWQNVVTEFQYITDFVNNLIKENISRPYHIVIELLALTYEKAGGFCRVNKYAETHNRRLVSNYFLLKAEHSLKVGENRYSLYAQWLSLDWYASKGFIRNLDSDYIGIYMENSIEALRHIVNELKGEKNVLFSQNGKLKDINNIANRLLK